MDTRETGKAIAYLRKAKNLTQKDIAERLNISDKAVSKWERGLAIPDVSLLSKLSIMLNTDIESLLEGNVAHYDHRWVGLIVLNPDSCDDFLMRTILFDKPLVYFQLSYFMLVGIRKVCIVCSRETEAYILGLTDWKQLGIELFFAKWGLDSTLSSDQVKKGIVKFLSMDSDSDLMVLYGDVFMYGLDLTKHFQRAMAKVSRQRSRSAVLLLQGSQGMYYLDEDKVRKRPGNLAPESSSALGLAYSISPLLFLSRGLAKENSSQILECSWMISEMIDAGTTYNVIGRGLLFKKIESLEAANDTANLVRLIQETTGDKIADLLEIARMRGLV